MMMPMMAVIPSTSSGLSSWHKVKSLTDCGSVTSCTALPIPENTWKITPNKIFQPPPASDNSKRCIPLKTQCLPAM